LSLLVAGVMPPKRTGVARPTSWPGSGLLGLGVVDIGVVVPETFHVDRSFLPQHVIDGPAQASGQDAQGLGLAVLLFPAGQEALGLVALPGQQAGRLREGPGVRSQEDRTRGE